MNDAYLTITGNLVDDPKLRKTRNGITVATFRVAQTSRRYAKDQGGWIDRDTLFVSCSAWRAMAENVHQSLAKGMPVVVYGRFSQHEFMSGETLRTAYELEALAVGPDLNRGVTTFEKVVRSGPTMAIEVDDEGIPVDRSAEYLDLEDDGSVPVAEVDPVTGEIRELAAI